MVDAQATVVEASGHATDAVAEATLRVPGAGRDRPGDRRSEVWTYNALSRQDEKPMVLYDLEIEVEELDDG